jgi:hypothetical protein
MLAAVVGYATVFVAVTATAYAGRAPLAPTVVMSVLLVAGTLAVATVGVVTLTQLAGPDPDRPVADRTVTEIGRVGR